ncbi:H-NS family nucleoid-associated regulatory protein [Aliidiomarina sp. Khilg15.8]
MSDFLNILTHERRLRANTKNLTISELEEVKAKLQRVIAAREEEEAELRKEQKEKQARIEEIKKQMASAGVDIADLAPELESLTKETKSKAKRKRTPKPAKYQYTDQGEQKTWTGQGRTPKVIQKALDSGKSLKEFLIK